MPYLLRHADGSPQSLHLHEVPGADFVSADHPEAQVFFGGGAERDSFARLDAELIRVMEDLVDVLIARQVIRITDLPAEAQEKLFARKSFRERRSSHSLQLYAMDDGGLVNTDFGTL